MPEGLLSLAGRAAPWLLTYLLHSSALILAAWALDRAGLVRRARSLDALWKVAIVGGFLTATVAVVRARPLPGQAFTRVQAVVRRDVSPRAEAGLARATQGGGMGSRATVVEPSAECRSLMRGAPGGDAWIAALEAACLPAARDWRSLLALVWAAGVGGLILLAVRDRRVLVRALADGRPAFGRVAAIAATLSRPGRPRPPVLVSSAFPAPCAVRGRVILPTRCEAEMSDGELTAVLAHEIAHLERRDPAWLAVADLIRRVAWIQPLNRVALAGVRDAAELVTDLRALRRAPALDLARSLHRVSAWALPAARPGAGPARVAGLVRTGDGSLTRRMRRILSPTAARGAGSPWPGALLALGLTAGAMLLPPVAARRVLRAVLVEQVERGVDATAPPPGEEGAARASVPGRETRVVIRVLRDDLRPAPPTATRE